MEITYELLRKDFYESFIAHRDRTRLRKWLFRGVMILVFVILALALIGAAVTESTVLVSSVFPLFVGGVLWVWIYWGSPWFMAKNQFVRQPSAQGPRTALLDDTGIHWRWSGGSADIEWKNFIKFLESKDHFLLYASPIMFNIVPKRALTPDQVTEFRQFIRTHIPQNRN